MNTRVTKDVILDCNSVSIDEAKDRYSTIVIV